MDALIVASFIIGAGFVDRLSSSGTGLRAAGV